MKIKNITIQGFRGFNGERTIDFHNRLTLIYAPNSYGKTEVVDYLMLPIYNVEGREESEGSREDSDGAEV